MNTGSASDTTLVQPLDLGGGGPIVVVKDCIDIAGTVTGCGSEAFADAVPAQANASVIDELLSKGCRIVGKANMHELAFGMTGINAFHGTPVNPAWPDRIPGGSSSGSAVAVAAGLCDFAIGTDTGGSVRQPATCCGIVGIKPTFGRICREGLLPKDTTLDCIGAFARDVETLEIALGAMDPTFVRESRNEAPRLAWIEANADQDVSEGLAHCLQIILPNIPHETLPGLDAACQAGMTVISHETAAAFGDLLDADAALGADIRKRLEAAREVTTEELACAEDIRERFTQDVDALLQQYDALVMPTLPTVPPTLKEAKNPQSILPLAKFMRPFNLSGHPAITIPELSRAGLPIGFQIVGQKGEDAKLCAIAHWFHTKLSRLRSTAKDR